MSAAGDHLQDTAHRAALALPDVSHGYFFTPRLDVYKVAGKVFLIVTDDPDEQIITVKREPEHARAQVRGYASISPGRYLDKRCAGIAQTSAFRCPPRPVPRLAQSASELGRVLEGLVEPGWSSGAVAGGDPEDEVVRDAVDAGLGGDRVFAA